MFQKFIMKNYTKYKSHKLDNVDNGRKLKSHEIFCIEFLARKT